MTTPYSIPTLPSELLSEFSEFAHSLADEARKMFAPHLHQAPGVQLKADRSLVTELDGAIELHLRERIEERYPDHGIYGEEEGQVRLDAQFVWVLDPIDGTAAFIAGLPVFGSLIALLDDGMPVLGLMDLPVTQERWIGVVGRPTLHQGAPCRTRACSALTDAMLSASNPDFFSTEELPALTELRARTRWRIYGASCMAYGLLASGRTDMALDAGLNLYDYAPFIPIVQGAGGVITDWEGRVPSLRHHGPRILAAGDAARHREALALVRKATA